MTGQVNGFIAVCRQHDNVTDFLSYWCIIRHKHLNTTSLENKILILKNYIFLNTHSGQNHFGVFLSNNWQKGNKTDGQISLSDPQPTMDNL